MKLEFFFDCSSPWTYLAFHRVEDVCRETSALLEWRPILVGGVFNAVNPSVYASRATPVLPKRDYMLKDLQDWARHSGLKIVMPPKVFPVNSVKAMRGCLWLQPQGRLVPFASAANNSTRLDMLFEPGKRMVPRAALLAGKSRNSITSRILLFQPVSAGCPGTRKNTQQSPGIFG